MAVAPLPVSLEMELVAESRQHQHEWDTRDAKTIFSCGKSILVARASGLHHTSAGYESAAHKMAGEDGSGRVPGAFRTMDVE
eukprot:gene11034-biopygen19851